MTGGISQSLLWRKSRKVRVPFSDDIDSGSVVKLFSCSANVCAWRRRGKSMRRGKRMRRTGKRMRRKGKRIRRRGKRMRRAEAGGGKGDGRKKEKWT